MAVTFRVEHFEGPLDLLLQLVEQEELDISHVSLAKVAEQFVEYVHQSAHILPEELADFLVVAAKLMYIKSKLLLPELHDPELEEGPDLESQLREYQRFVAASKEIDARWKTGNRSFIRVGTGVKVQPTGFIPPLEVTVEVLHTAMQRIIARLEPIIRLPQASLERAVSIQDKIHALFERVKRQARTSFHAFVAGSAGRTETIVSFLALLELVKQRFVRVDQKSLFHDIAIIAHESPPDAEIVADSFV